ncbi:CBS domain-containing protein [uncultured Paracoccus sp.]|uniref:CBS domain-containing protein n=1 Tax=uncultured Paracoccus sp. TaxID=189685 RepID=UPI00260C048F|nr:CBS domain-containing protein [uncultured Paracoccus sp.]
MTASPRVASLLHGPVTPLAESDSIRAAAERLVAYRAAALPVADAAGGLVGVLSQKDCFGPALTASYHQEWRGTVADHMAREVITIDAETEIVAAARIFQSQPHRTLPVMRGDALVGMLRRSDVLRALLAMTSGRWQ